MTNTSATKTRNDFIERPLHWWLVFGFATLPDHQVVSEGSAADVSALCRARLALMESVPVSLAPQPLESFVARARAALTSALLPRRYNVVLDAVTRVLSLRIK